MGKGRITRRSVVGGLAGAAATSPLSAGTASVPQTTKAFRFFGAAQFGGTLEAISAGEAATEPGELFLVEDSAQNLIFRERTPAGSTETVRSLSPAALTSPSAMSSVGFTQGGAPFIQTNGALQKLREVGASVRDTGAAGDFTADDTAALQEIADYFGARGGKWYLPAGIYKTTAPITFNCSSPQIICGQGQRGVYPGRFDPQAATELAVVVPAHSGRAAFQFAGNTSGDGSITVRDLAIATLGTEHRPEACFGWDTTNEVFLRNFNFLFTSINGFTSAFDVYQSAGAMKQAGLFRAKHCNIHNNEWIARTLNGTQWNGFDFLNNEAGQNGYLPGQGGIDIAGHAINISGNCFEGMRDPIRIFGPYRGVDIRGNYFEGNVGKALIHLVGVRGPFEIGSQAHSAVDFTKLEHHVLLTDCGHGRCLPPYRANGVHKLAPQVTGNDPITGDNVNNPNVGTAVDGWLRCDTPLHSGVACPPLEVSTSRVDVMARELSPFDGRPMPVAEYRSSSAEAIAADHPVTGKPGDWIVVSFLMKRTTDAPSDTDPVIKIMAHGVEGSEGRDYPVRNFSQWWRTDEWCLMTAAIKLTRPSVRIASAVFPYGKSPPSNLRAHFLKPLVYIAKNPDAISPVFDRWTAHSISAAPSEGEWKQGDTLYNANPSASGQAQFLCIESGAPGTWTYA